MIGEPKLQAGADTSDRDQYEKNAGRLAEMSSKNVGELSDDELETMLAERKTLRSAQSENIGRAQDEATAENAERNAEKARQVAEAKKVAEDAARSEQAAAHAVKEAEDAAKATALAEQIKSGNVGLSEEEKGLDASRAQYTKDTEEKAARVTPSQILFGAKASSAEELMQRDAKDEDRDRDARIKQQELYATRARVKNEKRPWYKKLLRQGKVSAEDMMMEEAKQEDEKFETSQKRHELVTKLFSGEESLDMTSMDSLKDIYREYGAHTICEIFEADMEKNSGGAFSIRRSQQLDRLREVIGKDSYSDQYYKQTLLQALAKGWTDTMYNKQTGTLTGRFAEFNGDREFVANAVKAMDYRDRKLNSR